MQQYGREPSIQEIARALSWPESRVKSVRNVAKDPVSLNAPIAMKKIPYLENLLKIKSLKALKTLLHSKY